MSHDVFMSATIDEARRGLEAGEVPIGAVLVIDDRIVARAFNQPITAVDPTAHAEVLAPVLRDRHIRTWLAWKRLPSQLRGTSRRKARIRRTATGRCLGMEL